jgi:alpha-tubulin suppressor-like RCC1 family protein
MRQARIFLLSSVVFAVVAACSPTKRLIGTGGAGTSSSGAGAHGGASASGSTSGGGLDGGDGGTDAADTGGGDGDAAPTQGPVEVVVGGDEEEANNHHACARYADGRVFCWGLNTWGQAGADPAAMNMVLTPVQVMGLTDAVKLAAGSSHSCALRATGNVVCWGDNGLGELGVPPAVSGLATPMPQAVTLPLTATDVSAGDVWTCATLKDGSLYCWGADGGRFGTGTAGPNTPTPTLVPTSFLLSRVSIGPYAACGIDSAHSVVCWGEGGQGDLGNGMPGTQGSLNKPTLTFGFGTALEIHENVVGACAYASPADTTDGIYCWGSNVSAVLGHAAPPGGESDSPTLVPEFTKSAGVVTFGSGYYNTCAVFASGTVDCVGETSFGAVGSPYVPTPTTSSNPVTVANLNDAVQVSVGPGFACAVRKGGGPTGGPSVACWGGNADGQLGNGTTMNSPAPVQVMLP